MDIVERLNDDSQCFCSIRKEAADEIERLREALLKIEQQSMETHIRMWAHQAVQLNEARILATNTYEAEGRN